MHTSAREKTSVSEHEYMQVNVWQMLVPGIKEGKCQPVQFSDLVVGTCMMSTVPGECTGLEKKTNKKKVKIRPLTFSSDCAIDCKVNWCTHETIHPISWL